MKKVINKLALFSLGMILLQACTKEPTFNYATDRVGISRIVYYPSVQIKGERLITLDQGSAFTDPGVEAKLNGQDITTTVSGTVDVNTPGVYELEYSAASPDGFSASDWRTVVVMSNSAEVTNNDFSGPYKRDNGIDVTWTKTGRGMYSVDNPGGAGVGVGFIVILVNYEGNEISIPKQMAFDPSSGGLNTISSNSELYNATSNPVTVKYALTAGGYGTQVRNFTKQ